MTITFGSVGDIISVCALVKEVATALKEAGGSSSEYQTTIRELENLEAALKELQSLASLCDRLGGYEALAQRAKLEAQKCRALIEPFRDKIAKYSKALHIGGSGSSVGDASRKLQWRFSKKDELTEFRRAISTQTEVMTVIILTSKIKADVMTDASVDRRLQRIEEVGDEVADMQKRFLEKQKAMLEELRERLEPLQEAARLPQPGTRTYSQWITPQISERLQLIWDIAFKTWRGVLLLHNRLPRLLSPWTGQPAILDDALCRVAPIPLELVDTWLVFDAVLLARFEATEGLQRIKERQYSLQDAVSKEDLRRGKTFKECFKPGRRIVMSALFLDEHIDDQSCPQCRKQNPGPADEEIFCPCGMRYQRITDASTNEGQGEDRSSSSDASALFTDKVDNFRRVRLAPPPTFGLPSDLWTCCQCDQSNLVAIVGDFCLICGHKRCAACSWYIYRMTRCRKLSHITRTAKLIRKEKEKFK